MQSSTGVRHPLPERHDLHVETFKTPSTLSRETARRLPGSFDDRRCSAATSGDFDGKDAF